MVERFIAPVLKTKKVPRRKSLIYEGIRTEASEKVPKRMCICQYAVNTSSTEITQSGRAMVVQDSLTFGLKAGRVVPTSSVKLRALRWGYCRRCNRCTQMSS